MLTSCLFFAVFFLYPPRSLPPFLFLFQLSLVMPDDGVCDLPVITLSDILWEKICFCALPAAVI